MIIYSVEITIDKIVHDTWLQWMKETHIPELMNTNLFIDFKFFKNLSQDKRTTYTIQYKLKNIENYYHYIEFFAAKLQKDHNDKFKNLFSAQRQLLKVIED